MKNRLFFVMISIGIALSLVTVIDQRNPFFWLIVGFIVAVIASMCVAANRSFHRWTEDYRHQTRSAEFMAHKIRPKDWKEVNK